MGSPGSKAVEIDLRVGPNRIRVKRAGRGRPLVLYHGAYLSSILFDPIIPLLARSFEVFAPDLPGHGNSEVVEWWRPDLVEFTADLLKALGLTGASFVGSSFGGGILSHFAADYPDRLEKLVLVSPVGWPAAEVEAEIRKRPKLKDLFEAFQESIHDCRLATRELYQKFNRLQQISGPFISRFRATLPDGYRERGAVAAMKSIRAPTLVVWGDEDSLMPFAFAERVAGCIPGARLQVMPTTGHFPYFEQPRQFADLVVRFLNS